MRNIIRQWWHTYVRKSTPIAPQLPQAVPKGPRCRLTPEEYHKAHLDRVVELKQAQALKDAYETHQFELSQDWQGRVCYSTHGYPWTRKLK